MEAGVSSRVIRSISSTAWPSEKPGAGEPVIVAEGNMLKRFTVSGPTLLDTRTRVLSGTIFPSALRTSRRLMSSGFMRNGWSAWTITRQVRPKRLKSLTYAEPRLAFRVSNTVCRGTFIRLAFSRSTSA